MTLADFDSRILVLGYWLSDTQFSPLINKDSTDKFLKNVLLIGERFPKSSVVVRMKSIEGQQSELMLDLFAQHSNLFLCDDYSDFGISYFLCAQADVIVSVQTSLAEECLAYGKRVILIDDYGTFDGVCSDIYPEDFHFAIASSDVDLLKMISLCLANDASLDRKYQALASTVGACRGADPDATCRALEALLV
jgi:hypothetical protein